MRCFISLSTDSTFLEVLNYSPSSNEALRHFVRVNAISEGGWRVLLNIALKIQLSTPTIQLKEITAVVDRVLLNGWVANQNHALTTNITENSSAF